MAGPRTVEPLYRGPVAGARVLLRPKWLLLHVVTVAAIVTMILLGRWQLTVSESKHFSLQNFGYALQWWLFSTFVAGMWVRIVRDTLRRSDEDAPPVPQQAEPAGDPDAPVAYRRYVMPQSADGPSQVLDDEQIAYNAYLARLAEKAEATDRGKKGTSR